MRIINLDVVGDENDENGILHPAHMLRPSRSLSREKQGILSPQEGTAAPVWSLKPMSKQKNGAPAQFTPGCLQS